MCHFAIVRVLQTGGKSKISDLARGLIYDCDTKVACTGEKKALEGYLANRFMCITMYIPVSACHKNHAPDSIADGYRHQIIQKKAAPG